MNCYYFFCPKSYDYLDGTYFSSVWADTPREAETKCSSYVGECYLLRSKPKAVVIGSLQ